jgi:hypothetical protein
MSFLHVILTPFRWIWQKIIAPVFFNVNKYTTIPIFVKFLTEFFAKKLPLVFTIIFRFLLGAISILFSNLLQIIVEENCPKDSNSFKIILKQLYISFIQYAGAYLFPTLILLILDFFGVGEFIQGSEEMPIIGHVIKILLWIVGYSMSGWLIKKINFGHKCSDKVTTFNHVLGILSIVIVIGYEGFHVFF